MHDEEKLIKFIKAMLRAKELLVEVHKQPQNIELQSALLERLKLADPYDLLEKDLSHDAIVDLLKDFDFPTPELLEQVILENTIIPANAIKLLTEEKVKHKGEIWLIYKYDVDPFPSNPHAHNKENGLSLHLGTGELYLKRQFSGKISKKDLQAIRRLIKTVNLPKSLN